MWTYKSVVPFYARNPKTLPKNTRVRTLSYEESCPALSGRDLAIIMIALVGMVAVWSFLPGLLALALLG